MSTATKLKRARLGYAVLCFTPGSLVPKAAATVTAIPIVGWDTIDLRGKVETSAVDRAGVRYTNYAILHPNGIVVAPEGAFHNVGDWVEGPDCTKRQHWANEKCGRRIVFKKVIE